MRSFLISLWIAFFIFGPARAQVVTAPYTVSQRLMNPAAAVTRRYQTIAVALESTNEKMNVLGLSESNFVEKITINQLLIHSAWRTQKNYFFELDVAYQAGVKTKENSDSSSGTTFSQTNEDHLNLIPVQFMVGKPLSPTINGGIKTIATMAKVNTTTEYRNGFDDRTTTVSDRNKLDAQLIVVGLGLSYSPEKSLSFSYAADFNQFRFGRNATGSATTITTGNSTQTSTIDIQSNTSILVRRDILGVGFSSGDHRSTAFRTELSYERISPIQEMKTLKEGNKIRATAEAQWSFFRFGVEYTTSKGYMIDSYNLIPYFFKFEKFSNIAVTDLGFFGGFRSTKGHSVGASFSQSSEQGKESLSTSDPNEYDVDRKTTNMGLSYSYVF